jgi:hypothetical protein
MEDFWLILAQKKIIHVLVLGHDKGLDQELLLWPSQMVFYRVLQRYFLDEGISSDLPEFHFLWTGTVLRNMIFWTLLRVLVSSFLRVLSLSWSTIIERVSVFIDKSMYRSRCTNWVCNMCHIKIGCIARGITRSFYHKVSIVKYVSQKPSRRGVYLLYVIYRCLGHFSIEKFYLIIRYYAAICQEEYVEFIIHPLYKYIL